MPPLEWIPGLPDLWTELPRLVSPQGQHTKVCAWGWQSLGVNRRARCSGRGRCQGTGGTIFQPASLLLPKWSYPQKENACLYLPGHFAWHVAGSSGSCTAPGEFQSQAVFEGPFPVSY